MVISFTPMLKKNKVHSLMQNNYGHSLTTMLKTIEKLHSLMHNNMVIALLSNVENKKKSYSLMDQEIWS